MGNPELRRDSAEHAWVEYLQGVLANRLATEAHATEVRLSPVDGRFGPITEGSVEFFQRREGLPATGVVDEATWQALEAEPAPRPLAPLDLRVPFHLVLPWPETTVERMVHDFRGFDLARHPGARLRLGGSGLGPVAGNGGVELLNREIRLWPNWFLSHTHRFTLDWSHREGFELGLENEADFGVRVLRNVELTVHGEFTARYSPQDHRGDFDWYIGPRATWRFDLVK